MTKFVEKIKKAGLLTAFTAFVMIIVTSCAKETPETEKPVVTQEAPAAEEPQETPATEDLDLTQSTNLFEEPLQPNPLANADDDVVVTVDGEKITHGEIMQGVQLNMMQLSRQIPQQQLAQMTGQIYQNVTDTLIANILLTEAAKKSSLAVSDSDLDAEINRIKENAPEGSSLEEALAENHIDYDDWKENLREQMLVRKLVDEKTAGVAEASDAEVSDFYQKNIDSFKVPETVSASHILVAVNPGDTDEIKAEKRKKLEIIRDQIIAGGNFEEIAKKQSDCPSAQRGGDLGTFARGQMVPTFEEAAFSANVGDITDIVETQFGYHIIKVTDHQPARIRPLAEVSTQLKAYLTEQKKQKKLLAYVDELKAEADIEFQNKTLDADPQKKPAE